MPKKVTKPVFVSETPRNDKVVDVDDTPAGRYTWVTSPDKQLLNGATSVPIAKGQLFYYKVVIR